MKRLVYKYNKLTIQSKSALWFAFCSIIQKGISMLTIPIFTRLLSTEEYGTFSIFLSWLSILGVFTSLNLFYGIFNNAMFDYERDRDRYISSMQGLVTTITSFVFIIFWIGKDYFTQILGLSTLLMTLMFVDMLMSPSLQFWSARQRFEYKYKQLVAVSLLQAICNPLLGVIMVIISQERDIARIASVVLVDVFLCGSLMVHQYKKGRVFFDKNYWKYAFCFNLPLLPHYLSGMLLNQGDRIVIDNLVGKSAVAIYSVAYNVGMLMQVFLYAINSAFTPWMYTSLRDKNYSEIRKVTSLLLVIMAGLVIILMAFAPEIVKVIATLEYYDAIYVIPPIAASVFFLFMYAIFSNLEFYFKKNKFIMIASIGAALLNIGLNIIFIPVFGYYAAGYTTLFSYILFCTSHYAFSRIISKKELEGEQICDVKVMILLSLALVVATVLFSFLYRMFVIRYLLIITLLIVAFIKRKDIFLAINYLKKG